MRVSDLIRKDIDLIESTELDEGPLRNLGLATGMAASLLGAHPGKAAEPVINNPYYYQNVSNTQPLSPEAERVIDTKIMPFWHSLSPQMQMAMSNHLRGPRLYVRHWQTKYPRMSEVQLLDNWMKRAQKLLQTVNPTDHPARGEVDLSGTDR